MAAYVIAHVDVTDPIAYQEYIRMSPESIKAYGGRFLARAGETQVLEGDWQPKRLVILEFPSADAGAHVVGVGRVRARQGDAERDVEQRADPHRRRAGVAPDDLLLVAW